MISQGIYKHPPPWRKGSPTSHAFTEGLREYGKYISLLLDIVIILKTVGVVLFPKGSR